MVSKIIVVFALCMASTLAMPKATPKGDWAVCAQTLQNTLIATLETTLANVRVCTADYVEEMQALEQELMDSFQASIAAIKEQVAVLEACGDDSECRVAAIQEIAGLIARNIQDNTEIVKKHLAALEVKFPEAADCARDAFQVMANEITAAAHAFVACITA